MRPKLASGWRVATKPVDAERDDSGADPDPASVLANALPHQPRAADLSDGGGYEEVDRAQGIHGESLSRPIRGSQLCRGR